MSTFDNNNSSNSPVFDSTGSEIRKKQLRALRKKRYEQMVANTNELLTLAMELNTELSASHSNTLTADQLRMLARIEKLARNVKQEMLMPVPMEIPLEPSPPVNPYLFPELLQR